MAHGISRLDEFYRTPLNWPDAERTDTIGNTFLKVAALSKSTLTPHTSLPFSAVESRFLIGLTFRLMLWGIIFCSWRGASSPQPDCWDKSWFFALCKIPLLPK
jgi:hypothetical protein